MSTRRWGWKAGTVVRALACAQRAGLCVTGYSVNSKTGTITVLTGQPADAGGNSKSTDWDEAIRQNEKSAPTA